MSNNNDRNQEDEIIFLMNEGEWVKYERGSKHLLVLNTRNGLVRDRVLWNQKEWYLKYEQGKSPALPEADRPKELQEGHFILREATSGEKEAFIRTQLLRQSMKPAMKDNRQRLIFIARMRALVDAEPILAQLKKEPQP